MTLNEQIKSARQKVNELKFGTEEWESAMQVVRELVQIEMEDDSIPFVVNYAISY